MRSPLRIFGKPSAQKNFAIMVFGAIAVALVLVVISMQIYTNSGAAQIDFSRPSYQAVRSKVQQNERFEGFDTSKPLNEESLNNFEELYKKKKTEVRKATESFSPDALSNEALGIKVE